MLRDDHAGTIEQVDPTLVRLLLANGYVPVLTPPALGEAGVPINVDGDKLALELAVALGANGLLFFSDTPGLLADRHDEASLIREIPKAKADDFMQYAEGRMKKKVMGAVEAISEGVRKVIFADGRVDAPISQALAGSGTHIA